MNEDLQTEHQKLRDSLLGVGFTSDHRQGVGIASGIDLLWWAVDTLEILFYHDTQKPTTVTFWLVIQPNLFGTICPSFCVILRDGHREFTIFKLCCPRQKITGNPQAVQ